MQTWQLQEAKAHLSKLVKSVLTEGPQQITVNKEPAVIILSVKEYNKLRAPKKSFVAFMQESPLCGLELDISRNQSLTRDISL
jgi:antitoxin Phd